MQPASSCAVAEFRRQVHARLGSETVRALHRQSAVLDVLLAVAPVAVFLACFWAAGLDRLHWSAKAVLSLVGGWALHGIGLAAHDLCTHRKRGGAAGRAFVTCAVALYGGKLSAYTAIHYRHHALLGRPGDPEQFMGRLDTWWKRAVFATYPGLALETGRGLLSGCGTYGADVMATLPPEQARSVRREKRLAAAVFAGMLVYACFEPGRVLWGWVVPLMVVAPVLISLRVTLEHADADSSHAAWGGTHYRGGWIARVVYLAGSGDCHQVHHLFPRIPCYRMPRAVRLIAPLFAEAGAPQRRSFWALQKAWFVRVLAHRTPWQL